MHRANLYLHKTFAVFALEHYPLPHSLDGPQTRPLRGTQAFMYAKSVGEQVCSAAFASRRVIARREMKRLNMVTPVKDILLTRVSTAPYMYIFLIEVRAKGNQAPPRRNAP
jgi:hypothetical protein